MLNQMFASFCHEHLQDLRATLFGADDGLQIQRGTVGIEDQHLGGLSKWPPVEEAFVRSRQFAKAAGPVRDPGRNGVVEHEVVADDERQRSGDARLLPSRLP